MRRSSATAPSDSGPAARGSVLSGSSVGNRRLSKGDVVFVSGFRGGRTSYWWPLLKSGEGLPLIYVCDEEYDFGGRMCSVPAFVSVHQNFSQALPLDQFDTVRVHPCVANLSELVSHPGMIRLCNMTHGLEYLNGIQAKVITTDWNVPRCNCITSFAQAGVVCVLKHQMERLVVSGDSDPILDPVWVSFRLGEIYQKMAVHRDDVRYMFHKLTSSKGTPSSFRTLADVTPVLANLLSSLCKLGTSLQPWILNLSVVSRESLSLVIPRQDVADHEQLDRGHTVVI